MSKVFKNLDSRIARIQRAAANKTAPARAEAKRAADYAKMVAEMTAEKEVIDAFRARVDREAPAILSRKGIRVGDYREAHRVIAWMLPDNLKFTEDGLKNVMEALMLMWMQGDEFLSTKEYEEMRMEVREMETKRETENRDFRRIAREVIAALHADNTKCRLKSGKEIPTLWNYHATMKAIRNAAPVGFRGLRGVLIAQEVMHDSELDDRWSQFMEEDRKHWETREIAFRAEKDAERKAARKGGRKHADDAHVGFAVGAETEQDPDLEDPINNGWEDYEAAAITGEADDAPWRAEALKDAPSV